METDQILIANLSCNGCVNTITKKIGEIEGIEKVIVSLEDHQVSILHQEKVTRDQLTDRLKSLGYPEVTDKNDLLTHLRSVGSCLSGRISK